MTNQPQNDRQPSERVFLFVAVALIVGMGLIWKTPARAQEKSEAGESAELLVQRLGSNTFSERERASYQLLEIGPSALPALEKGRHSADREVRYRCERIAKTIRAEDLERRLESFAAGNVDTKEASPPGWREYSRVVGASDESRRWFVAMHRAAPELLASFNDGQAALKELSKQLEIAAVRVRRISHPSVDDAAVLLFVGGDGDLALSHEAAMAICEICCTETVRHTLQDEMSGRIFQPLLGRFIRRVQGPPALHATAIALQYNLKAGLAPAIDILRHSNETEPLSYAILAAARFGDKNHLPLLEKQFDNSGRCAVVRAGETEYETQVRDVALAAAINLTGRDLERFGFHRAQGHPQLGFVISTLGFATEEARNKAFEKWRTKEKANKTK